MYGAENVEFKFSRLRRHLNWKSERCQQRFLKKLFFVPKFTPKHLLLKLSELDSVESVIALSPGGGGGHLNVT